MNVTPSLVGSMRLRLFSMYKRLEIKVEEERRRDKEVSFGVFERKTQLNKQVQERAFSLKINLFSRPKSALFLWPHENIALGSYGKEGQLLQAKLLFFPRKEKHSVEEKRVTRVVFRTSTVNQRLESGSVPTRARCDETKCAQSTRPWNCSIARSRLPSLLLFRSHKFSFSFSRCSCCC